jgi:hypothetical protein
VVQRRSSKRGPREGHASCVCPYVGVGVVSWTGGASRCPRGATKGADAPWLCGYARETGSTMQGPRRRAFGRVSSASGVGSARLRRRAPGTGILAGTTTGGIRAAGSVDATLHGTRRRCDGSRRQVDRWTLRWCEHSTGGRLDDGNLANEDMWARSKGDWGKTAPTGGPHLPTTAAR